MLPILHETHVFTMTVFILLSTKLLRVSLIEIYYLYRDMSLQPITKYTIPVLYKP